MTLISAETLTATLPGAVLYHWRTLPIANVVCDSRQVQPGDMFVAYVGVSQDGHRFVSQALAKGAVAFVVERSLPELAGMPTAVVPDGREAYALLQAALYDHPGRNLCVIGVTGTDGKTTTVRLIANILRASGKKVGSVDTVGARIGDEEVDTGYHTTTPDAAQIQGYLADMVEAGTDYAVLEATSEGLAQHRVTGCEFDVAVVTNITHEHLYFHGTYEAYREAKGMLFRALQSSVRKAGVPKVAVLNADDTSFAYLSQFGADISLSYGLDASADVRARDVRLLPEGLRMVLELPEGTQAIIESSLPGRYNVSNILAAASVAYSQGMPVEAIREGVAAMGPVPGRMERVRLGQPFETIVDFAHTPNALANALQTVREFTSGRVIAVFGCAGLRDVAKRPMMGEISARLADLTIITAEDPRTEPLGEIMEQIAQGCQHAGAFEGQDFIKIPDREMAIAEAVALARPGDTVLICGKGHERSMCFGSTEYPWSDVEAAKRALNALGYNGP